MEGIKKLIKEYTGHRNVFLTTRGNEAILAAMKAAHAANPKKYILVQDQGGWLTYRNFPKKAGLELKYIKTDYGLISPDSLDLEDACAIIFTNPAGYIAEQDTKGIYEKCSGKCIVIIDVTGCIGDSEVCVGKFADIMVASFGKDKPVNAGYGGFVSSDKDIDAKDNFDIHEKEKVYLGLKNVKDRLKKLYSISQNIKEDLKEHDVIHREKKGINVIVKFCSEEEKAVIIGYCEKHLYEWVLCPTYIRVSCDAISIEVKRLL